MEDAALVDCRLLRYAFLNNNLGGETDLSSVSFHETTRIECRYSSSHRR